MKRREGEGEGEGEGGEEEEGEGGRGSSGWEEGVREKKGKNGIMIVCV